MEGRLTREDVSASSNVGFGFPSSSDAPPRCRSVTSSLDKLSLEQSSPKEASFSGSTRALPSFSSYNLHYDVSSSSGNVSQSSLSRSLSLEVLSISEDQQKLSNSA